MYRRVLFTAALAAAFATGPARAQPQPPAPRPTPVREELPHEARRAWDSGIELFDAGDTEGALIEFGRAHELSRNPRVLFNVGVCLKKLGRYARAAATWRRELAEAGDALADEDRRKIEASIAAVQEFVSRLRVRANEPGAVLGIDDETVGTTPFADPLPIDVGAHRLVLRKDGFVDQSVEVTVSRGVLAEVSLELVPLRVRVAVEVRGPSAASVFVDGTDMGPAPFHGPLPLGRRTFEARAQGFVPTRQTSDLVAGEPLALVLWPSPERHEGRLRVTSSEADAVIEVDGKVVGSGGWTGVLPTGGHQVGVRKDGFAPYLTDVALADGQMRDLEVPLEREVGGATWAVWVAGALGIATGAGVASYFAFRPAEHTPVSGSLTPGLVETSLPATGGAAAPWTFTLGGSFE
ncbi:MAG: PEGA domain-containing protein [Myxococcales bacterium]|nr:PEGA domain-containing protein [Myxococcales bacterium]